MINNFYNNNDSYSKNNSRNNSGNRYNSRPAPKKYSRNFTGMGTEINTEARQSDRMNNEARQNRNYNSNKTAYNNRFLRVYVQKGDFDSLPSMSSPGAAGHDISSSENIVIPAGKTILVATGLKMAIPRGYEMQIRSRSGLCLNNSVIVFNSPGTIDSDYRGEIKVIMHNASDKDFSINKGDRIAQGVFSRVPSIKFVLCDTLYDTTRGSSGFGSTGTTKQFSNGNAEENYSDSDEENWEEEDSEEESSSGVEQTQDCSLF